MKRFQLNVYESPFANRAARDSAVALVGRGKPIEAAKRIPGYTRVINAVHIDLAVKEAKRLLPDAEIKVGPEGIVAVIFKRPPQRERPGRAR